MQILGPHIELFFLVRSWFGPEKVYFYSSPATPSDSVAGWQKTTQRNTVCLSCVLFLDNCSWTTSPIAFVWTWNHMTEFCPVGIKAPLPGLALRPSSHSVIISCLDAKDPREALGKGGSMTVTPEDPVVIKWGSIPHWREGKDQRYFMKALKF